MTQYILNAIILNLFFALAHGSDAYIGFNAKNQFLLGRYSGKILVLCEDIENSVTWDCEDWGFTKPENEYFYHPSVEANRFELRVQHSDNTVLKVNGEFVPEKGRSAKKIDIWNSSLRDSLMGLGSNRIEFSLFKGEKLVDSGEFRVVLEKSTEVSYKCPQTFDSGDDFDCLFPIRACARYFVEIKKRCEVQ